MSPSLNPTFYKDIHNITEMVRFMLVFQFDNNSDNPFILAPDQENCPSWSFKRKSLSTNKTYNFNGDENMQGSYLLYE